MARITFRRGRVAVFSLSLVTFAVSALLLFRSPSPPRSFQLGPDAWRIPQSTSRPRMQEIVAWSSRQGTRNKSASFWRQLASDLSATKPRNEQIRKGPPPRGISIPGAALYTVDMTNQEVQHMKQAHESFARLANTSPPEGIFMPGSRGIVTTAGGKYIPIFLVTLRLLRRTGSDLPVELFLADEAEWNEQLCTTELPKYNARCRVLSRTLESAPHEPIKMYQFKVFAILFSSFEDVVFIDADSAPAIDPESLLDEGPYQETGMIVWPDFWPATVSPIFQQIQERVGKPLSEKTAETGELLFSKRRHWSTLLLAVYYNYFGPGCYYSLLSQGAPGEGDKETFTAAADFFEKPYYRVPHPVSALGWFDRDHNNEFRGVAMIQSDPRVNETRKPAFIHANFPKLDPFQLLHSGQTHWQDGTSHRIWAISPEQAAMVSWGQDPEMAAFEEMIHVACQLDHLMRSEVSSQEAQTECRLLRDHYETLFGLSFL